MTNPAENGDDSNDFLDGALNPGTNDRASETTREYAPNLEAKAVDELILSGLALLSSEVPIPVRLGKYTIQGQVGRGGMGIVWKGFDPDLHRTVAIKVLSPHLALSQVARRRFQREARAAAAINHENVLTIHSVEEQGETPFLVMEFVSGQSLKEYVVGRGKLDVIEVIRLSAQIAQGLAAAHAQGVIHRDVKPANVMLHEGATRVRLMDFGLARVAFDNADLTSHDHAVGTPAYMAPEQIHGHSIDARADLFSLGCVMYCMVAGHSPFHGRTHAETIHKIIDLVPARLHDVDPAVPHVLSEMVEKLLAKNPDDRYQSAFEVADVLKKLLVQLNQTPTDELVDVLSDRARTIVAKDQEVVKAKPSKVSRGGMVALLAVAFVVLVGGFVAWKYWPDDSKLTPFAGESSTPHGTNSKASDTSPAAPVVPKLTAITVGSGPDATCTTLNEAIRRAAKNCTITVVGPGPYVETLKVQGAALNGLTLTAKPRARLRIASTGSSILSITDVSGVTVEGFDFDFEGVDGHGLDVSGIVDNLTVKNCSFSHATDTSTQSLVAVRSHSSQPDSAVRIQRCQFDSRSGSYCLSADAGEFTLPSLVCEGCQFSAPYTQFYATQSCRRLRLAGNVFVGATNAINLDIKSWSPDSRIEIVNNTFVGTRYWLGFVGSFRSVSVPSGQTDSRVCNNLILGGEQVQAGDDQLKLVSGTWQFSSNWSEQDGMTIPNEGWTGRLAELHTPRDDVPFRDVAHPLFLVPAAGSLLLTSGSGGDLPSYIGAKGPVASQ